LALNTSVVEIYKAVLNKRHTCLLICIKIISFRACLFLFKAEDMISGVEGSISDTVPGRRSQTYSYEKRNCICKKMNIE